MVTNRLPGRVRTKFFVAAFHGPLRTARQFQVERLAQSDEIQTVRSDSCNLRAGLRRDVSLLEALFITCNWEYLIPTHVVNVCFRQLVLNNSDYSGKLKFFSCIDCAVYC